MGPRIQSALGSPRAVLDAAERADPFGHAVHLALAVMWAFLQSITNAGEGIAWGMCLGFCILRVPKIWWCWSCAMRDALWWVMVGWFAWTSLTSAWGPDLGTTTPSPIPDRWLVTPLMLWPVMGRPWLVLGAMAVGAALNSSVSLVLSWEGGGWRTYEGVRALSSLKMSAWQFVSGLVLCVAGIRWLPSVARMAAMAAAVPCALGVWILAVRTVMVAATVGCAAVCLRPMPRVRVVHWTSLGVGSMALLAGVLVVARSPAWERMNDGLEQAERFFAEGREDAAVGAASGARLTLVRAAIDIGLERPVLGGGNGWFEARLPQWALVQVVQGRQERADMEGLLHGSINNAHSALLHAWVDGGIPSAAFLATLLFGLAWRLWTQSRSAPIAAVALALYSVVLVNVPFGIPTTKAPGAIIATALAISWLGAGSVPRARILQPNP